jgi:hypothetical protein
VHRLTGTKGAVLPDVEPEIDPDAKLELPRAPAAQPRHQVAAEGPGAAAHVRETPAQVGRPRDERDLAPIPCATRRRGARDSHGLIGGQRRRGSVRTA